MKKYIPLYEWSPEHVLAEDVIMDDGTRLLRAGTVLTRSLVDKLSFLGVMGVFVKDVDALQAGTTLQDVPAGSANLKRVLIVDDLQVNRKLIANILKNAFSEVEIMEASDGLSAVEMYPYVKPEIVFMDILMPGMDGITAIKRIKQINQQAKIIVCSTEGEGKMVLNAIHSGATDFIVKPYYRSRVLQAVTTVLER